MISLHTPLNRDGEHPTRHLLDEPRLAALRPGTWLVNASRGAVVDNQALRRLLEGGADLEVALDVWEGEPQADPELAARCLIATPHIAGYSLEGKLRGTAQIYQAYCAWRGIAERVSLQDVLPETWLAGLQLNPGCDPAWALATLCRAVYDPRSDDAAFRRSLTGDSATRRAAFDALRKHYPPRREITGLRVATGGQAELQRVVRALGRSWSRGVRLGRFLSPHLPEQLLGRLLPPIGKHVDHLALADLLLQALPVFGVVEVAVQLGE